MTSWGPNSSDEGLHFEHGECHLFFPFLFINLHKNKSAKSKWRRKESYVLRRLRIKNKSTIVKQCMSNGAEGHYQFFKDKIPPQITEKMLLKPYLYVPDLGSHQLV